MSDRPAVSVVMPAHNRADRIAVAIDSIRSQTLRDLEIVVVDDASTDETVSVVKGIADTEPRLRLIQFEQNRGAQAARNAGIKAARGEWIAFLDSDDIYYPDSLEVRLAAAEQRGLDVIYTDCDAVDDRGPVPSPVRGVEGDVRRELLSGPGPMFQSLLVRAELFPRIGYLDEKVPSYQEWDTSIRLSAVSRFGFLPAATFRYDRATPGAISGSAARGARGYSYVVRSHRREIVREAGIRALSEHYRQIATMWIEAREWRSGASALLLAQLLWPLTPRRNARVFKRFLRAALGR